MSKLINVLCIILAILVLACVVTYVAGANRNYIHSSDFAALSQKTDEQTPAPAATPGTAPDPVETAPVEPVEETPESVVLPYPDLPDVDFDSWELMLVSLAHPLDPEDYGPPETANFEGQIIDSRILEPMTQFVNDCREAGNSVYFSSAYRSYEDQRYLYNLKVQQYGEDIAKTIVLPPATSEHQTGLCADITDIYRNPKDPDVLCQTETFKWMEEHCQDYGFIVRYPKDRQNITGVIYEPWHFRYVGVEAATYIMEHDITLEEFVAMHEANLAAENG